MSSLLWVGITVLGCYLLFLGVLYLAQSQMVYHPSGPIYATPADIGLEYEEVTFSAGDGVRLTGWYIPAEDSSRTVLFQHGNAGNISGRLETIELLHKLNLTVFIYDYRGYGRSAGQPSEEGTYSDALGAWNYLVEKKRIAPAEIVVMGRSLGGSVAAWLASRVDPAAVIIESSFTSAADLAGDLYPFIPARWLVAYNYHTTRYLEEISTPVLVTHSREDRLIPFHHGERIFEGAKEPKTFVALRGDHGRAHVVSGDRYRSALEKFINGISN